MRPHWVTKYVRALRDRAPFRLAAQTAVAALAAFLAARAFGVSSESWAVFSAVFVVQTNIGATVLAAAGRAFGGMVGLALGLVCLWTFGVGPLWATVAALIVAVAAMSLLTHRWPKLSYGLVTAPILIVSPMPDLQEGALEFAGLIALGSAIGALATVAVFPQTAAMAAKRDFASALRMAGAAIRKGIHDTFDGDGSAGSVVTVDSKVRRRIDDARQAYRHSWSGIVGKEEREPLAQGLDSFVHLESALSGLDRLIDWRPSEQARTVLADPMREAADAIEADLNWLAEAAETGRAASREAAAPGAMGKLRKAARSLPQQESEPDDVPTGEAIRLTLAKISHSIEALERELVLGRRD